MCLSERECQRWRSLERRRVISKAKIPTLCFLGGFGGGGGGRIEASFVVSAVLSLTSHVSGAILGEIGRGIMEESEVLER